MNRQQAIQLIQQTFEAPFERERYIRFLRELLNGFDAEGARVNQGSRIPEKFQDYVEKMERVGKYVTEKNEVMLFIVHLKRETSIERARTMQRNFVAWYLQRDMKDAALVAFVSPNAEDWRFSLVKMEYRIEEGAKVKEEFTPARRWSFLVGVNEKSHTAQSRFVPLLEDDEHKPSLAQLEEAFNIEKVTKEFFEKYRDLFVRTKEALDQAVEANPAARSDFEAKGVDTVNLAKKLLGQIIFLYYLQKKGWFGVPRDAAWGAGSKRFLRELFEKRHGDYRNFFNDILEPLFYEALRIDRSHDDHYYSRFNCKIPFLNGGLFDPLNNYDWVHTDLLLPNELFSNTHKTREGDTGDGILDVFDRYNFTVKEDEPFEKEVAIDPELLGKAYEKFNAIRPDNYEAYLQALRSGKKGEESKFNKQYGVYYTPREIVHYMCQQSLIQYLYSEVSSSRIQGSGGESGANAIVEYSEAELANLGLPTKAEIETLILRGEQIREHDEQVIAAGRETETYSFQMPESIRNNAARLDRALAEIKVCDPAAGSGAFPVGMMNEIVKARLALAVYYPPRSPHFQGKWGDAREGRGVGTRGAYHFKRACIENSLYGVDIDPGAVEIAKLRLWLSLVVDEDDPQNIKPLPNLDYKIVCGNSLLGVEKDLFNHALFAELERLKPLYFNETQPARKQQLKAQIDRLIDQLTNGRAQFDFEIYFSEVFHQNGGFDVVIGNPPYLDGRQISIEEIRTYKKLFESADGKVNIFNLFIEKSINLIKNNAINCFIVPSPILRNSRYHAIRNFILDKAQIHSIVLLDEMQFESAVVENIILLLIKRNLTVAPREVHIFFGINSAPRNIIHQDKFKTMRASRFLVTLTPSEMKLLEKVQKQSIKLQDICQIRDGISTGFMPFPEILLGKLSENLFISKSGNKEEFNKNIHKKVIDGGEFTKFSPIFWEQRYIKYDKSIEQNPKPPNGKPFNCQLREREIFEVPEKIISRQTSDRLIATLDTEQYYTRNSVHNISLIDDKFDIKFVLGVYNSKLLNFVYQKTTEEVGKVMPQVHIADLNELPIPNVEISRQRPIINLVERILAAKRADPQADTSELEREIDRLVYQLYGLTEEEIAIVSRN
ncbi:MAG: Eco57I restriction-modification methylase domain-containing protein [Chloroflexi bacterium]|nr:Eco57I restriction-modification methylase domain-containing protein [Chloroflexota bacterium]MBI5704361.1 Eco57I restriction-modification methylase domain-containing protein [Chloroflexota bacterium]